MAYGAQSACSECVPTMPIVTGGGVLPVEKRCTSAGPGLPSCGAELASGIQSSWLGAAWNVKAKDAAGCPGGPDTSPVSGAAVIKSSSRFTAETEGALCPENAASELIAGPRPMV